MSRESMVKSINESLDGKWNDIVRHIMLVRGGHNQAVVENTLTALRQIAKDRGLKFEASEYPSEYGYNLLRCVYQREATGGC